MKKVEQALSYFEDGFNCAQSVFASFNQELDMERGNAFKISSVFGGGMARTGKTCGAVTGAMMALGMKYATNSDSNGKLYGKVNEFITKFKARNNTLLCNELLGYPINTVEGMKVIQEKKLFKTLCPKYVQDAVEILEEMFLNENSL